ncbi:MIF4G domain protein [Trichinella nativa]|uniref:MIF4G domain protein n=1 Tax=Trichinella nativa TaxID=6335 RepID=A0A1Y3EHQ0_9BILA|nr:MIF4G domain protein [Trichinella nativa]
MSTVEVKSLGSGVEPVTDDEILSSIQQSIDRLGRKREIRQANLTAVETRPDETFLRKLDSSLKKNTAFVKRLKTFTESQSANIIRDFRTLNLSRYVTEMVSSLCEAKLKNSDIIPLIEFCSLAHQRYADFSGFLLDYFKRTFSSSDSKVATNMSKLRVDLRFLVELLLHGILTEKEAAPVLLDAVTIITRLEKERKFTFLSTLVSFCRQCGEDLLGLLPRNFRTVAQQKKIDYHCSDLISEELREKLMMKVKAYYNALIVHVSGLNGELLKMRQKNMRQMESKGEVHPAAVRNFEELKSTLDKLIQSMNTLANWLDVDTPHLPDEATLEESGESIQKSVVSKSSEESQSESPFEDEESRLFYTSLPQLKEMLPQILFQDAQKNQENFSSEKDMEAMRALEKEMSEQMKKQSQPLQVDNELKMEKQNGVDQSSVSYTDVDGISEETNTAELEDECVKSENCKSVNNGEKSEEDHEDSSNVSSSILQMKSFIAKLPLLINRDLIDQAAIEYATHLNTKSNRRRLIKTLFEVHRSRLDLLPFYSRLIAILDPVFPDIRNEICHLLISQFRHHIRKKDQVQIESKVKVCRYIGELVKFGIFPKSDALLCFKLLLMDFRHHNIEMACAILDSSGYYLFHSSDSHLKMKFLLEQMKRRAETLYLDFRYQGMIMNAYYTCYPESVQPVVESCDQVEVPIVFKYIWHLVSNRTVLKEVEFVLKEMQKIDWSDANVVNYVVRIFSEPWLLRAQYFNCIASVLCGIAEFYPIVGVRVSLYVCYYSSTFIIIQVADNVLEIFRSSLESDSMLNQQQRMSLCMYMGELYNYKLINTSAYFNSLYLLLTLNVENVEGADIPTPVEGLFRIRLACAMLQLCGSYFSRGVGAQKMTCYLKYLQQYCLRQASRQCWKNDESAVLKVKALLKETIEGLRKHGFVIFSTLEEANEAISAMEADCRTRMEHLVKTRYCCNDSAMHEMYELEEQLPDSGELDVDVAQEFNKCALGDEEFLNDSSFNVEYEKLVNNMIQQRINEQVKIPQFDTAPSQITKNNQINIANAEIVQEPEDSVTSEQKVKFLLLTKNKSNRSVVKTIQVPEGSDLAMNWKHREAAALKEKERMKRLTLNMTQRMQYEDNADANQSPHTNADTFLESKKSSIGYQMKQTNTKEFPGNSREMNSNGWF